MATYLTNPVHSLTSNNATWLKPNVLPLVTYEGRQKAPLLMLASLANIPPELSAYNGLQLPGQTMNLQLKTMTTRGWELKWPVQSEKPKSVTLTANALAAATSLPAGTNAAAITVNDILRNHRTGEYVRVTAVAAPNLTVVRSHGAIAAADMNSGDVLSVVGTAFSETDGPVFTSSIEAVMKSNYIQEFRTYIAVTEGVERQDFFNAPRAQFGDKAPVRRKKTVEATLSHIFDVERACIVGAKEAGTSADGAPWYTMGGLLEQIQTNVLPIGGTLTKATFQNFLSSCMNFGVSNEKFIMASDLVLNAIGNFAADTATTPSSQFWFANGDSHYKLQVRTITNNVGTFHLIRHAMLNEIGLNGHMFVLDPSQMAFVQQEGGFFFNIREDIVQDGRHVMVDEIVTDGSFVLLNEKACGVATGITG